MSESTDSRQVCMAANCEAKLATDCERKWRYCGAHEWRPEAQTNCAPRLVARRHGAEAVVCDAVGDNGAVLSPCARYRYRLWRTLPSGKDSATFIMLNPSTADASANDPTIRKCLGFAERWGVGKIEVVNLFAFRATDPRELLGPHPIQGPDNNRYIDEAMCESSTVVFAWGAIHKAHESRAYEVINMVANRFRPKCLGLTKQGQPRHPLMLAYATQLEEFRR